MITQTQNQTLKQSTTLSLQAQQAVRLLAMSAEEAEAFVAAEALKNPILKPVRRPSGAAMTDVIEATAIRPETLREGLKRQLLEAGLSEQALVQGVAYLIDCLDDQGFLRDRDEIITTTGLARALGVLQSFDPAGVGACNLIDCWRLQLERAGRWTRFWSGRWTRLFAHADLIEARRFDALARRLDMPMAEIADMVRTLRELNVHPYEAPEVSAHNREPDMCLRMNENGEMEIELISDRTVQVRIDREALNTLKALKKDGVEVQYVEAQIAHAKWLREACHRRRDTMVKVTGFAVGRQYTAIMDGMAGLKPLTMREAASALSVHESTVSRAVANKLLAVPSGVIDVRDLFSSAMAHGQGDESVAALRHKIKALIEVEPAGQPYCDRVLAEKLSTQGLRVSRRNVSKHRKAMGISSATMRRRDNALEDMMV